MSAFRHTSLLLAFGLVLLLALIAFLPTYPGASRSPVAKTTDQLIVYRVGSTAFFEASGRWPTSVTELVTNSMGIAFVGPSPPLPDGWGRQIVFEPYATNMGHGRFVSYGRDGKPGGVGADADLDRRFP